MTIKHAAITVLALGISGSAFAGHELDNRDLMNGAALYQENCASCHGVNLEGQPNWRSRNEDGTLPAPPHDASGHTWHHDNELLFNYTKLGGEKLLAARGVNAFQSGMPGFEEVLSEDQIWDILSYIQSTWPEDIQDTQARLNPEH